MSLRFGRGGFIDRDWDRYDVLQFAVHNEGEIPAMVRLRLDDDVGGRALRYFNAPPGERSRFEVSVASLAAELDVTRMEALTFYMRQPPERFVLRLDDVQLEAFPADPEAVVRVDPFFGGAVIVQAKAGRPVVWSVAVSEKGGDPQVRYTEYARRLKWRQEEPLPAGRYQLALVMSDTTYERQPVEIDLGGFVVLEKGRRPSLATWYEPSTKKILLHERPLAGQLLGTDRVLAAGKAPPARVEMARNEYEAVQVVFLSDGNPMQLRFELGELVEQAENRQLKDANVALYQVGYVYARKPEEYPVEHTGWWPDPLLPFETMRVEPGECAPLWISVRSGTETVPGLYRGNLAVWGAPIEGDRLPAFVRVGQFPLEIRVWDASIPDSTTARTAFSMRDHALKRLYGERLSPALYRNYQNFVTDHRLNVDNIYRHKPPDLGTVRRLVAAGKLNSFNLMYMKPEEVDEQSDLDRITGILDPYVERLRDLGLADRAYIYGFDEVYADRFDQLREVFGFLKRRYPDIQNDDDGPGPGLRNREWVVGRCGHLGTPDAGI